MDQDCVHFLQWALPRLDMEWRGFRKVRRQVCKRIQKRMDLLEISDWKSYRKYLENNQVEWKVLDGFCRITISRFYRDYVIYDYIGETFIPRLIRLFPDKEHFNFISLGCASGEEPYTLAILWEEKVGSLISDRTVRILGLDVDHHLLERANKAKYPSSSLREIPEEWGRMAFQENNGLFKLKNGYKDMVEFINADIRKFNFKGPYHLVCCRNLVATYFSKPLQLEIFKKICDAMPVGAALVLGTHEKLTKDVKGFRQDNNIKQVYWAISTDDFI